MKKRLGFVSNSSSSSFIICIAKIIDEEKLKKYLTSKGIDGVHIDTVENLKNRWDFNVKNNKLFLESFMNDVSTEFISMDDKIIYYDITGGSDSDFWNGHYYDYDIDLNFFSFDEIEIYKLFSEKNIGIENGDVSYGAGRN